MRRHLIGIGLAIVMTLAMFFLGSWGFVRLLRVPAPATAPLSALPAQGGSLLSNTSVLSAMGALAVTALLAGVLIAVRRVSPLAAGLPGLFALAWQGLFLSSVRQAVDVIPLRSHAFGVGWEGLLFTGVLGAAGLAMVVPLFVPSRWRSLAGEEDVTVDADADVTEATGYMADLKDSVRSGDTERIPAGASAATTQVGMQRPGGMSRPGMRRPGRAPGAGDQAGRTGLVGGQPRQGGAPRMRPRRGPGDDF